MTIDVSQERDRMIQEIYQHDPWKMMVCCIFLNQTGRDQVDQIRTKFFESYPDPATAERADSGEMSEMIAPLGFKNRRTETIKKFSSDWLHKEWKDPIELYGIGKYGQDSWEIFQGCNLEVKPTDGALIGYLNRIKKDKHENRNNVLVL
jgi:methyl-CpG-binding domain protein 4